MWLGYTLAHAEAVRAIAAAGLDPFIGFYHELQHGRGSLACDLVEPERPSVDAWVWHAFRERHLRPEHFRYGEGRCLLGKAGR
jgi:CRISP-associated protein Cas1